MNAQAWAGRGEPDYAALSRATLDVEGAACNLVDALDNAERVTLANDVQRAVELLRDVRRRCDAARVDAERRATCNAHLRWIPENDDTLRDGWGDALRAARGDTEAAVAALAARVGRTPVAVAARLVKLGIWK